MCTFISCDQSSVSYTQPVTPSSCRPLAGTGVHEKRRLVLTRRRKVRGCLRGFVAVGRAARLGRINVALGNERVRLIGELGEG